MPKVNKKDYVNLKSYRVISLLNCLGKVLDMTQEAVPGVKRWYVQITKVSGRNNRRLDVELAPPASLLRSSADKLTKVA